LDSVEPRQLIVLKKRIMVRKSKIILTDCDGACLDWEFGFQTWMMAHGHKMVDKNVYSVAEQYEMEQTSAKQLVRTFNESAAIGFLPPLRDAQYYIKLLHEKHQYRFVAITSLSLDPYAKKLRERNLAKLFGPNTFKDVITLDCGADKDDVLERVSKQYPGALWIEDKPENVDVGMKYGLKGILVEHGHNLDYKGDAIVVKDWESIYNFVTMGEK